MHNVEANKGHVAARRGVPQDDARHNADGWSISVSTKMDAVQRSAGKARKRMRVVLAVAMTDGRCLLSVVSPRYVPAIDRTMSRARGIVRYDWYVSDDDFFSSFPSVRTPRGAL